MDEIYKDCDYKDLPINDSTELPCKEYILDEKGILSEAGAEEQQAETPKESSIEIDSSEIESLKKQIEELQHELASVRADFYNFRQRTARDKQRNRQFAVEDTISEILPVLDNLDRALLTPESCSAKDVLTGVRMVQRQFISVLDGMGVKVIPTSGAVFDPSMHEAVEIELVDDPEKENAVLEELVRGYRTEERILRAAHVKVAKLSN